MKSIEFKPDEPLDHGIHNHLPRDDHGIHSEHRGIPQR